MYMSKHVLVRFNKTWDGYIVSYSVANSEEKEEAILTICFFPARNLQELTLPTGQTNVAVIAQQIHWTTYISYRFPSIFWQMFIHIQ
jgi:hypothetical protein